MNRLFGWTVTLLLLIQAATIIGSWLFSAFAPDDVIGRSLLSSEGVRWMFLHSSESMLTPPLLWIILAQIAWGLMCGSGLHDCIATVCQRRTPTYRQRTALIIVSLAALLITGVMLSLTVLPHALLLSTTGTLIPGPFAQSAVPLVCFCLMIVSLVYGLTAGTLNDMQTLGHNLIRCIDARLIILCILVSLIIHTWMYLIA